MTRQPLTDREASVLAALDSEALIDAVQRLVRVESWNGNETPAQDIMEELMLACGLDVDRWELDLPTLHAHSECAFEIERASAVGLVGSLRGSGDGRSLVLNGHVDVVPPGDPSLWNGSPFDGRVEGGRIHGRGALDMKGPLVAGLFAVRAVREVGVRLSGDVHVQSVVGEEDGGIGTLAAVLRHGRADGAVVMEPTGLVVAPVQAGCVNFRVRVPGRAAHGAVRAEGVSAFDKLFLVYRALQELETRRNASIKGASLFSRYPIPFPISVGTIGGGDWASSVPDHATMEGRLGVRPDEDLAEARASLERAVADAARSDPWLRKHPPAVEWWGGRFLPVSTELDHPLIRTLRASIEDVRGEAVPLEGVPFGSDAGLLAHVGHTPTVLFGAGDVRGAHRPNESVRIDDLVVQAQALALLCLRFCA